MSLVAASFKASSLPEPSSSACDSLPKLWGRRFQLSRQSIGSPSHLYLGVNADGTVWIIAHRSEMGTTSRTSPPLVLADELDADWNRVKVQQAIGDARYGSQDTDGSHSVREFYQPMRAAGATARLMLIRAAAQQWGMPEAECSTEPHAVIHQASNRKAGYGQLAAQPPSFPSRRRKNSNSNHRPHGGTSARARPATISRTSAPAKRYSAWTLARRHGLRFHRTSAGPRGESEVV